MNNIEIDILLLTEQWSECLADHKTKEKDFCWYIQIEWVDGLKPVYYVRHDGNVVANIERKCKSYDEALIVLKEVIQNTMERLKTP